MPSTEANCWKVEVVSRLVYAVETNQPHYWLSTGLFLSHNCHQKQLLSKVSIEEEEGCKITFDKCVIEVEQTCRERCSYECAVQRIVTAEHPDQETEHIRNLLCPFPVLTHTHP